MELIHNTSDAGNDELLTVQEVAKLLRVDDTTVRRWIKKGYLQALTLPHRRGGNKVYRVKRSTLNALLTAPPETNGEEFR